MRGLSLDQLAVKLRTTRPSLATWMTDPSAPKSRDPKEWRVWIKANGKGKAGQKITQTSAQLRDEHIRLKNERLKVALQRDRAEVIARSDMDALLLPLASSVKTRLYNFAESEGPPKL